MKSYNGKINDKTFTIKKYQKKARNVFSYQ